MKLRYFFIPIFILSLMVFIVDSERNVINKEVLSFGVNISYPFFGNEVIDSYISDYLDFDTYEGDVYIDYDIYDNDDIYYLTFYRYFDNDGVMRRDSDSFVVDVSKGSIGVSSLVSYDYDVIFNRVVNRDKKVIALTFDDGPNYNTNRLIDVLNEYNVKATFFVLGSRAFDNEEIIRKMSDSGMEIGNHTFNHLLLTRESEDVIKREIEDTNNIIYSFTGKMPSLLRPSYGSVNSKIKKMVNMPIIIWDIDTLDWKYHNSKRITSRVVNKARDGDIILMHDIYSASVNAVLNIIPILQKEGYEFVTVSELFYYKGITLDNGKVYGMAR